MSKKAQTKRLLSIFDRANIAPIAKIFAAYDQKNTASIGRYLRIQSGLSVSLEPCIEKTVDYWSTEMLDKAKNCST